MERIDGFVHSDITDQEIAYWHNHHQNADGELRVLLFRKPDMFAGNNPFPEGITTHQQVLDPFGERVAILLDRDSVRGFMDHRFRPHVMFDSSAIGIMVQASKALKGEPLKELPSWDIVDPIVDSHFELNIDFYVYESMLTNGDSKETLDRLIDPVARIFEIGNCNRDPWIRERKLVVNTASAEGVFAEARVSTFEELAEAHISMLHDRWLNGVAATFDHWETASYLMLLKTIVLSSNSTQSVMDKMERLRAFELEALGVCFMREKLFAALYMEGRYQPARDFIKKDLKNKGLRAKLRGSARDLLLPRLAEKYLSANLRERKIVVPHIFTFDRPFLEISSPIRIHHLFCRRGETAWTVVYDHDHLKRQFAKSVSQEVFETLSIIPTTPRASKGAHTTGQLKEMLSDLENQAAKCLSVHL